MALSTAQLLSGAGRVARSWREEEEAQRVAQQNQLNVEEQNRLALLKQRMAAEAPLMFKQAPGPQDIPGFAPGANMGMDQIPQPAAAPVPVPGQRQLPAGVQPSQAGAGRGVVNPPLAGQPQPQAPQTSATMTPEQIQRERDRLALLRAPTALADVVQAPAAAGLNALGTVAAGAQNLVGRAVNAFTGEQTLPTDTPYQKYSLTPFTDRFVRQPEQALEAQLPKPATPAAQAPGKAAAPKPTAAAQQYDAKVTPYDALIAQSAQANGIDPVMFKRLLGTESSFNPTAVSPRGEQYGLGIAQIAAVHNLTREQRLDPNTAIPFAAQLFSQYLKANGGNYEQAVLQYKGATSDAGKASMASAVNTIVSGVMPSAQAATVPTPLEVPKTQARNMQMADFYLANPEAVPYEMKRVQQVYQQQATLLTQQRNEAARLAQMFMQSGTSQGINNAIQLRASINDLDAKLLGLQQDVETKHTYLQGMQGLRELALANDPRRLSGVLSTFMGAPVGIQPRSDGTYNYFVNGKKVKEGVSPTELASMALKEFSPEARAASAESAKLENELALKRKYGDAMVNAAKDIQKAIIEGEYKIAEKRAESMNGKLTIDTSKGVAYFQQGSNVFVINPDGKIEDTPLGKVELPSTARPVLGLNVGR